MYVYMDNMPNRKNVQYKQTALSSPTKTIVFMAFSS